MWSREVANLSDLATVLGIRIGEPFQEAAASETHHPEDADRLIALLMSAGDRWVPLAALARHLDLGVSETESLAACAKESLSEVGLDVLSSTDGLDLRLSCDTRIVSRQQLAQIQRDVNARSDIEELVALCVYRVITGTVTARKINASQLDGYYSAGR